MEVTNTLSQDGSLFTQPFLVSRATGALRDDTKTAVMQIIKMPVAIKAFTRNYTRGRHKIQQLYTTHKKVLSPAFSIKSNRSSAW